MSTIENYKLLTLKHKPNSSINYTIFAKEHLLRTNVPEKPNGRTLFLLNIPPYIGDTELRHCFERFGEIKSILFAEKPGKLYENDDNVAATSSSTDDVFIKQTSSSLYKFKVAYIVFKTTVSVREALKATELHCYDEETGTSIIKSGIKKWMQEYLDNIIDENILQTNIDEYMEIYDENQQKAHEIEKSGEVDDDGWIKVTKRGKNAGFEQNETKLNRLEEKLERRKKKKELKNFYTFQIKETKMKNIVSLRKKFEEDKEKLEALKKSRKFKPF